MMTDPANIAIFFLPGPNSNLPSICRMIRSHLFLAHVRASTTGGTSWANCHPFVYENWSFMHNGQVGNFAGRRRQLEALLPDDLYNIRSGSTDSELLFLLLLANGLETAPKRACEQVIAILEDTDDSESQPNRLTCVFSDGRKVYGFRHSCDLKSPSLYQSRNLAGGGHALASEPLDGEADNWISVGESEFLSIGAGKIDKQSLQPVRQLRGAA